MIYSKLSNLIFQQCLLPKGVEEKYKSMFSYGFEVILSSLVNMVILFTLSSILNVFTEMSCFLLTFIPLRIYGGGAHASSHSKCLMLFTLSMMAAIATGTIISQTNMYTPFILSGLICCMFIQYRFSADSQKRLRYKNQPLIKYTFPLTICLIASLALFSSFEPKYAVISVFGIYVQSISLLIKNLKGEKNYEKN